LPSDDPYSDIESLTQIKTNWGELEALMTDINGSLEKLTDQASPENKNELISTIGQYSDWLSKLPENTFQNLSDYIPEINSDNIKMPGNISTIASGKMISDYPKTYADYKSYIALRAEQVPTEVQLINSIQSRLQAIRLFDGMLRSYFSSINWADWESTRGF
jgi:hypothetical protein